MDLYLDSVDFQEIEQALEFGFIKGLTTVSYTHLTLPTTPYV